MKNANPPLSYIVNSSVGMEIQHYKIKVMMVVLCKTDLWIKEKLNLIQIVKRDVMIIVTVQIDI